jgi:hypothetical protein
LYRTSGKQSNPPTSENCGREACIVRPFRVGGGYREENIQDMNVLLVALGEAIGSVGGYLMGAWFQGVVGNPGFPWGTFFVNVAGSFLIGRPSA